MISPSGNPPRVGLIGVSGYASVYVDWLLEAHSKGKICISAIVALKQEQELPAVRDLLATGATLYDGYDSLFKSQKGLLDLCYIPTGIQWHARMAVAALRAGCNVLVEKPLAGSLADARQVQATEKETGKWVAVGFQDMYTEEMAALKRSLVEGRIGALKSVSMIGMWPRPASYYLRNQWAGKLMADKAQVLDSPLNNAFAHFVNLSLFLAGDKANSAAKAEVFKAQLLRAHDIESFDTAVVLAKSDNGVQFWFGVSHACRQAREPSIRIVGERGAAEWRHEQTCVIEVDGKVVETTPVPNYDTTRRKMFEHVLQRLSDPAVTTCETDIAICHTAFIEAVHRAAKVATVDEGLIERVEIDGAGSSVPVIKGIEQQLEEAFENLSTLPNFKAASTSA